MTTMMGTGTTIGLQARREPGLEEAEHAASGIGSHVVSPGNERRANPSIGPAGNDGKCGRWIDEEITA
jgi:hypothetical protein